MLVRRPCRAEPGPQLGGGALTHVPPALLLHGARANLDAGLDLAIKETAGAQSSLKAGGASSAPATFTEERGWRPTA